MNAYDMILTRKSVRSYTGAHVDDELVEKIMLAGTRAPSGMANEPWRFAVVRDPKVKGEIAQLTKHTKVLEGADVLICLFMDNSVGYNATKDANTIGACAENMLLAAAGLGLGAVWLGLHPIQEAEEAMRQMLAIPEEVVPFAVVSIGHPGEQKAPHEAYEAERVHWERFGKEAAR